MSQSDADKAVRNAKLRINVVEEASSSVPKGKVIRDTPTGVQPEGTTVWVYVSSGPQEEQE